MDSSTTAPTEAHSKRRRPRRLPVRERMVRLRVTEAEYGALSARAEEAGVTLSALLRDHFGKVKVRHRQDERERVIMLNRINANLNMIAKWVNTYKGRADAVAVMAHLVAVEQELGRLLAAQEQA